MAPPAPTAQHVRVALKPGGLAVVTLCKEPANVLDLATWRALAAALDRLEADPAVRAAVFASGLRRDVFTAGNDIAELYKPTRGAYRAFWRASNEFLARLYTSRLATVAAVRGACPAGGCALALCCDARVMTEAGAIGLNEVALGIAVPRFWARLFQRQCARGDGAGERLLAAAAMLEPLAALEAGLVDAVVPAPALLAEAEAAARRLLALPDGARAETKRLLREPLAREWVAALDDEADYAVRQLNSPAVVATLEATMARLRGKRGGGGKGAPPGRSKL